MKRNADVSSSSVSSSLRIRRTQTHADKWSHFSSGCIRICIWQQHNLSFQLSCDFLISSAKLFQLCVFGIVLYWTPVGTWCVLNSLDPSHVCQAGEEQEGKLDVWLRDGRKGGGSFTSVVKFRTTVNKRTWVTSTGIKFSHLCPNMDWKQKKTLMAQNYKMLLIFVRGWQKLAFPSGGLESSSCQWHCLQEITALAFTLGRSRCRRCSQIVLRPTPVSEVPVFPDSYTTPVILKSQGSSAFTPCFRTFPVHLRHTRREATERCSHVVSSASIPADSVRQRAERVSKHESNPRRGELLICWLVNPMMHLWCGNIKLW